MSLFIDECIDENALKANFIIFLQFPTVNLLIDRNYIKFYRKPKTLKISPISLERNFWDQLAKFCNFAVI